MSVVLLTNNPKMVFDFSGMTWRPFTSSSPQVLRAGAKEKGRYSCFFFQDSALAALLAARDLIQSGWLLLHHPLYGNFRPHQQPYRSLILRFNPEAVRLEDGLERILPDEYSLHLIEEAVGLYRTVTVLTPERAPSAFRGDCAFLDYELMRLPLEQAGWPAAAPAGR